MKKSATISISFPSSRMNKVLNFLPCVFFFFCNSKWSAKVILKVARYTFKFLGHLFVRTHRWYTFYFSSEKPFRKLLVPLADFSPAWYCRSSFDYISSKIQDATSRQWALYIVPNNKISNQFTFITIMEISKNAQKVDNVCIVWCAPVFEVKYIYKFRQ